MLSLDRKLVTLGAIRLQVRRLSYKQLFHDHAITMNLNLRNVGTSTVIAFGLVCSGCGQSATQQVSGTVTLDGQPLATGEIEFVPSGDMKGPIAGATIENGAYEVPAIAQGLKTGGVYTVNITSMVGSGVFVNHPNEPSGKRESLKNIIPARYNELSDLSVTVTPGDNVHNFELKSQ